MAGLGPCDSLLEQVYKFKGVAFLNACQTEPVDFILREPRRCNKAMHGVEHGTVYWIVVKPAMGIHEGAIWAPSYTKILLQGIKCCW